MPDRRLRLVGFFEDGDPLPFDVRIRLETTERVILAGAVNDTRPYYAIADVLVLPSHREGLPTGILEAQAAGKPVVGASATAIVNLVTKGETGLLFPLGEATAPAKALAKRNTDK